MDILEIVVLVQTVAIVFLFWQSILDHKIFEKHQKALEIIEKQWDEFSDLNTRINEVKAIAERLLQDLKSHR